MKTVPPWSRFGSTFFFQWSHGILPWADINRNCNIFLSTWMQRIWALLVTLYTLTVLKSQFSMWKLILHTILSDKCLAVSPTSLHWHNNLLTMTIYFLVNNASCPYGQTWNVPPGWNDVLPVLYLDFDDLTCFTYVVGSSAVQISGKVCIPYKTLYRAPCSIICITLPNRNNSICLKRPVSLLFI